MKPYTQPVLGLVVPGLTAGCGGSGSLSSSTNTPGSGSSAGEQTLNPGPLTTRVAPTTQPPVTAGD